MLRRKKEILMKFWKVMVKSIDDSNLAGPCPPIYTY
jgi:hypothetical protein